MNSFKGHWRRHSISISHYSYCESEVSPANLVLVSPLELLAGFQYMVHSLGNLKSRPEQTSRHWKQALHSHGTHSHTQEAPPKLYILGSQSTQNGVQEWGGAERRTVHFKVRSIQGRVVTWMRCAWSQSLHSWPLPSPDPSTRLSLDPGKKQSSLFWEIEARAHGTDPVISDCLVLYKTSSKCVWFLLAWS